MTVWRVEVLVADEWREMRRSAGEVYDFESREDADRSARMCYPDEFVKMRLGDSPTVRVTERRSDSDTR